MKRDPEIPFTYHYSQPEEYHFSLDSIEMAWRVSKYLQRQNQSEAWKEWQCLDLCAGCGVIGFELNYHLPSLQHWDFLEVQEVYRSHFEVNRQKVIQRRGQFTEADFSGEFQFLNFNYDQILKEKKYQQRYQLVVCNPPYFLPEQGKLSPSEFKNRCRFFLDSSFENLIESIQQSLAMDGEAFLLLRDLEDHQIDLLVELRRILAGRLQCENLELIRGTFLLKLEHQS